MPAGVYPRESEGGHDKFWNVKPLDSTSSSDYKRNYTTIEGLMQENLFAITFIAVTYEVNR
jgi:hypothetical protein